MTTSSPKDYNKMAPQYTDMEYVELLGLDPNLAGTPAINKAIQEAVDKQNKEWKEQQ